MKVILFGILLAGAGMGCSPTAPPPLSTDNPANPNAAVGPLSGPSSLKDETPPAPATQEDMPQGGHLHAQ